MLKARRTRPINALSIAALLGASASSVHAQEATTLRIADSLPNGHIIHRIITKPFIERVESEAGGKIKFQHFPGEQLGKARDLLSLTQSGVVDVGYIVPAYASDKMPLTASMELPGAFTDYCQGMSAFHALSSNGGFLEQNEFIPNKVIPLVTFMLPPYQIVVGSSKKLDSLKDLEGLKVRSAGGAMDFMLKSLGLVPIRMTPPEVYESLSRGTIDGAVLPFQSVVSYKLTSLLKSATVKHNFGAVALTYSISEAKWRQLPESARTVLMKVGNDLSTASCKNFLAAENQAFEKVKEAGVAAVPFSPADEETLAKVFDEVGKDWAKSLDGRGLKGSAALEAARSAISAKK